jgi:hypothetical protein
LAKISAADQGRMILVPPISTNLSVSHVGTVTHATNSETARWIEDALIERTK